MDWMLNNWLFLIVVFTLFCCNTVWQYRLGFKSGTTGGYNVGMLHAIKWLMEHQALEVENKTTGEPASPAEVVVYILNKKTYIGMTADEAKFIAQAVIEKENS
jgi:hypothetical protein